ncbi:MAG: hypothetical protein R2827_09990 [Bdellovibrionales bacterium]
MVYKKALYSLMGCLLATIVLPVNSQAMTCQQLFGEGHLKLVYVNDNPTFATDFTDKIEQDRQYPIEAVDPVFYLLRNNLPLKEKYERWVLDNEVYTLLAAFVEPVRDI